jgi:hypothetical protein
VVFEAVAPAGSHRGGDALGILDVVPPGAPTLTDLDPYPAVDALFQEIHHGVFPLVLFGRRVFKCAGAGQEDIGWPNKELAELRELSFFQDTERIHDRGPEIPGRVRGERPDVLVQ